MSKDKDRASDMDVDIDIATNTTATAAGPGAKPTETLQEVLVAKILREGRKLQAQYSHSPDIRIKRGLDSAFSLMAYSNPLESPVASLLDLTSRDVLANSLNMAILAIESRPQLPSLEIMYRQSAIALGQLVREGDGNASLLRIERDALLSPTSH
ncbi:hypothetical protein EV182_006485, partial [Spiromyces aspiralis]